MQIPQLPTELEQFLKIRTPEKWCHIAIHHLPLLLIDHAHCERKAAASAIQLITKNPHFEKLLNELSPIAREELLHFEKVLELLKKRKIRFQPLNPSRYGKRLHQLRSQENNQEKLRDDLIIGAIIEARSCERFYALLPYLQDQELFKFYKHLAQAEARHFEVYLELANEIDAQFHHRIPDFITLENELILQEDDCFRFHSGPMTN